MTIKERIYVMIEQYSITKDNPTVLRELLKLAAIVDALTEGTIDLEEQFKELESKIQGLDIDTITEMIQSMQESVNRALEASGEAKAAAENASEKADSLSETVQEINEKVTALESAVEGKQDKLTFDTEPTEGSDNPVTSDGIKKAIDAIQSGGGSVTLDDTVTEDSENGVKSSGIYSAIQEAKTEVSGQAEAAKNAADAAQASADAAKTTAEQANTVAQGAQTSADEAKTAAHSAEEKAVSAVSEAQTAAEAAADALAEAASALDAIVKVRDEKQDKLTFDTEPTEGSDNPVTSDGIYSFSSKVKEDMAADLENTNKMVEAHSGEIEALQEFQQTQETTNETHNTQIAKNIDDINELKTEKMDQMTTESNPSAIIGSKVLTDLSVEPPEVAEPQLATALAVWKALQAVSGGGAGASYEITQVDVSFSKSGKSDVTFDCNTVPIFVSVSAPYGSSTRNIVGIAKFIAALRTRDTQIIDDYVASVSGYNTSKCGLAIAQCNAYFDGANVFVKNVQTIEIILTDGATPNTYLNVSNMGGIVYCLHKKS